MIKDIIIKWYVENKFPIKIVILFFLGIFLCELHSIIYEFWPETVNIYYDHLFIRKSYKQPLTVLYYTYEAAPYLDRFIWACMLYLVVRKRSYKISQISIVIAIFYAFQFYFYLYDRNTSLIRNISTYFCVSWIVSLLILPEKKKGNVINIDS